MIEGLDETTAGIVLAIVEFINVVKIGVHTGYLVEYINARNWEHIGWEIGAILFDLVQAVKGETSFTIGGHTYDFIEVNPEQQRLLASSASIDESIPNARNTSIIYGPDAFKLYIEGILSQIDSTYSSHQVNMECIN